MSKLNQIQRTLKEIDGAKFQQLCDMYLHHRGYERLNPIGLVTGTDKVVQGTPDSLVTLSNGKFVFVEYTTQQKNVCAKFLSDLGKCFNEKKTGIPVVNIQEIILCHNSVLSPAEENELMQMCQQHGCLLSIFGIGPLSYDLYQKYPGLARDFLGIHVDTGQIVKLREFITVYNKGFFATPLDTAFHFRDAEIEQILKALETTDLIVLAGRAGVGKTRLALECCERFAVANPAYQVFCIYNRGPALFEDLRVYFTPPHCYLILVDDANRINRFEHVLQLLHEQSVDRVIKIIATVRDYALDKIQAATKPYGGGIEVSLSPLTDEHITQLVSNTHNIHNHRYLERIAEIAKGNPRLAMMAAQVAVRENTLHSIVDVSALYDEYFSSIRQDLVYFDDKDVLRVAGIVAFFRVIDRSNEELMSEITNAFGVSVEGLWNAVRQLHDLELFDLYEGEVVRVSDQVLATYLFYLAFFKEQVLTFSHVLRHLFPQFRYRLIDALNPVLNTFQNGTLIHLLHTHVEQVASEMRHAGDKEAIVHLLEVFWFIKETDTLLYIQERITDLAVQEVDVSSLSFEPNSDIVSPSLLSLLSLFRSADETPRRIALELLLDYLMKCPVKVPQVLHLLIVDFGISHTSYDRHFQVEKTTVDVLGGRVQDGSNYLLARVFLTVAEAFLRIHFHSTESKGRSAVTVYNFELVATPEVLELRQAIWQILFRLFRQPTLQQDVLNVLLTYTQYEDPTVDKNIILVDSTALIPFINTEMDPTQYTHCVTAQRYFRWLDECNVPFDKTLQIRFRSDAYQFAGLFLRDLNDWTDVRWDEYQSQKQKRIEQHFKDYDLNDYRHFLELSNEIIITLDHNRDEFVAGIVMALRCLADRNPALYVRVIEEYLQQGNVLHLWEYPLVVKLIQVCGTESALCIITQPAYPSKRRWLFRFLEALSPAQIKPVHLARLYTLYQYAEVGEPPDTIEYLIKYRELDAKIVVHITEIVVEKTNQDARFGFYLQDLFNHHSTIATMLRDMFAEEVILLKRAYFAVHKMERYFDHTGTFFNIILDLDQDFAQEYVDWSCNYQEVPSHYDDHRDYTILWERADFKEVMERIIIHIYALETHHSLQQSYARMFFRKRNKEAKLDSLVYKRKLYLFTELIEHYSADIEFIAFLFLIIADLSVDIRQQLIAHFIEHNRHFDHFEQICLEPNAWSWSGSAVPMLQSRVDFFEALLPLFTTVDLLRHKQYIERIIQHLRDEIEQEKKHDFMRD